MEFVLIIYVYASVLSKGDSVALSSVPGFQTQQECEAAGAKAIKDIIPAVGFKNGSYSCLQRSVK